MTHEELAERLKAGELTVTATLDLRLVLSVEDELVMNIQMSPEGARNIAHGSF